MALYPSDAAQYRYFTTDLLTNTVLAEIPFTGVSFERSIKAAGSFSGKIAVIPETASMDLYDSTMPGKTALYVLRDGVCVWGGIIWSRSYNVVERELQVNGSEFTSYFYHRNIWKTWSHDFEAVVTVSGGTVTGTLVNLTYDFPPTSSIRIVFPTVSMYEYNGYYTVSSAPSQDTFVITGTSIPNGEYIGVTVYARVDTYDFVRQLLDEVLVDFSGTIFPNTEIEPALTQKVQITSKQISGGVATVTTAEDHNIIPAQTVEIYNVDSTFNGIWDVTSTPSSTSFTFALAASNVSLTSLTPLVSTAISKEVTDFTGTVTTSSSHGLSVGDTVAISGLDTVTVGIATAQLTNNIATLTTTSAHSANIGDVVVVSGVNSTYNGTYYVDDVPNSVTFTYEKTASNTPVASISGGTARIDGYTTVFDSTHTVFSVPTPTTFTIDIPDSDMATTTVSGTVTRTPTVQVGTYGSFPGNSDISLDYSTEEYSGKNVPNTNYRGYELKSVGEELDAYSDTVDGFEYRIDCALEYIGDVPTFTRTFVLLPIDFPNPPAAGDVSPPSRYGADQLVFEYPGSIIDVNMEESAEDAATRFFVVGNIPDLGEDASQPYAAATATDLLNAGWPILDQEETRSEASEEEQLYAHAQRYLAESRPPISDITVKVNGSLSPKIGEFVPGDWCSIVVNDEFIRMRLASDLEVRDTVLVRKIDGFKVSVPDTPSFPEETELVLVTEPEVDKVGE